MWVAVMGAPGGAKKEIAEFLGFKKKDHVNFTPDENPFLNHLMFYLNRLVSQKTIESDRDDSDFVTIGSVWEAVEVYAKVAMQRGDIVKKDYDILWGIYSHTTFSPPDAIFYSCPPKMTSYNKMMLSGENSIDQEYFDAIVCAYEELTNKVAMPVVRVERIENINDLKNDIEFNIASIKSSGVNVGSTIWKKKMFKGAGV